MTCVALHICVTELPYLLVDRRRFRSNLLAGRLLICWLMWSHFFVPQWDFPERLHHADTETCLPLPPQPGPNVSDTLYLPPHVNFQTARRKQLFIWTAGMRFAFHWSFTGLVSQLQSGVFNPWLSERLMCQQALLCLFVDSHWRQYCTTDTFFLIFIPAVQCRISTVWGLLKKGPSLTCPSWNICKSFCFTLSLLTCLQVC